MGVKIDRQGGRHQHATRTRRRRWRSRPRPLHINHPNDRHPPLGAQAPTTLFLLMDSAASAFARADVAALARAALVACATLAARRSSSCLSGLRASPVGTTDVASAATSAPRAALGGDVRDVLLADFGLAGADRPPASPRSRCAAPSWTRAGSGDDAGCGWRRRSAPSRWTWWAAGLRLSPSRCSSAGARDRDLHRHRPREAGATLPARRRAEPRRRRGAAARELIAALFVFTPPRARRRSTPSRTRGSRRRRGMVASAAIALGRASARPVRLGGVDGRYHREPTDGYHREPADGYHREPTGGGGPARRRPLPAQRRRRDPGSGRRRRRRRPAAAAAGSPRGGEDWLDDRHGDGREYDEYDDGRDYDGFDVPSPRGELGGFKTRREQALASRARAFLVRPRAEATARSPRRSAGRDQRQLVRGRARVRAELRCDGRAGAAVWITAGDPGGGARRRGFSCAAIKKERRRVHPQRRRRPRVLGACLIFPARAARATVPAAGCHFSGVATLDAFPGAAEARRPSDA